MRLPVLLNSEFCALDNYKRRRVPSSLDFSCRLIAAQKCLTRPKWRRQQQQQTYRPKSFNTSCTGNDVLWSLSRPI